MSTTKDFLYRIEGTPTEIASLMRALAAADRLVDQKNCQIAAIMQDNNRLAEEASALRLVAGFPQEAPSYYYVNGNKAVYEIDLPGDCAEKKLEFIDSPLYQRIATVTRDHDAGGVVKVSLGGDLVLEIEAGTVPFGGNIAGDALVGLCNEVLRLRRLLEERPVQPMAARRRNSVVIECQNDEDEP